MSNILGFLKKAIRFLTHAKEEHRHALVGPADLWEMKRDFQIRFLRDAGLRPEHYLLDIGCGTLRGGLPIIEYLDQGHYFGIESRTDVLDEGRQELREAGLENKTPNLIAAPDTSQLVLSEKLDLVWAFSVLIHMSDEILRETLEFVSRHLSDTGVFYANVNIGKGRDGKWQGFPVVWRTFEFYRSACAEHGLNVSDIGSLKEHGHITNSGKQDDQRLLRISRM